jgi:hypothetical protein
MRMLAHMTVQTPTVLAALAATMLMFTACSGDPAVSNDDTDTAETVETDTGEEIDSTVDLDSAATTDSAEPDTSARLCTPNEAFCVSFVEAGVCSATGDAAASSTMCQGASACNATSGVCEASICEPAAINCLNLDEFEQCAENGTGFGETMACPDDQFCANGQCRVCNTDKVECLGETVYRQCAPDSSGWSGELPCPNDGRCTSGRCRTCGLVEECLAPNKARRYCSSDELAYDETIICQVGQSCTNGLCLACDAGVPQCLSETTLRECQADGSSWGPEVACADGEICTEGVCIAYACTPRVLLVVDKSGSMGPHWGTVQASIETLVAQNPTVRFGLLSFPTGGWSCDVANALQVEFVQDNAMAFTNWFNTNNPSGATPMAMAMQATVGNAHDWFSGFGGAIIVLSDGQDTCFSGDITVDLAVSASSLFIDHDVKSYAIGYSFGGDPEELDTIANNGGAGLAGHIAAGDEDELTDAFDVIIKDVKLCGPEQ